MAKSMRSKWKRKCRNIKRERYAVKELARLKKTLGIKEDDKPTESEVMESDQVIFLDAGEVKQKSKNKRKLKIPEGEEEDVEMSSDDETVAVEGEKGKRVYSSKTLKDQYGQYPVWLSKRKQAKLNKNDQIKVKKRSNRKKRMHNGKSKRH